SSDGNVCGRRLLRPAWRRPRPAGEREIGPGACRDARSRDAACLSLARHTFVRRGMTQKRYRISGEPDEVRADLVRREPDHDGTLDDIWRRGRADDVESGVA